MNNLKYQFVKKNLQLLLTLTRREISAKYKGSIAGIGWSLLTPLLMMAIFTFVFGEIFSARWNMSETPGGINYATGLFSGLVLYSFFSESVGRAPSSLLENPNYIKKVVFPIAILPLTTNIAAIFQLVCSYMILLVLVAFSDWKFSIYTAWLPATIAPLIILSIGVSWILSALGVYIRDLSQTLPPILTALLFLSPTLYDSTILDKKFGWVIKLNPLTIPIEESRKVLLYSTPPNLADLSAYWVASLLLFYIGIKFFRKLRTGFADVI